MKDTLKVGDKHVFTFTVTEAQTVPALYPQSADFTTMPSVFATGFMVGLMEWACIDALRPHLDDGEGSLGIAINVSHSARHARHGPRHLHQGRGQAAAMAGPRRG